MSNPTAKPLRSRGACWSCKAIRRKCDETKPSCQRCQGRNITCEGYETRLQWGSGIASRGSFNGATAPIAAAVPVRPKGRKRVHKRPQRSELELEYSSMSPEMGLTGEAEFLNGNDELFADEDAFQLFNKFVTSGHRLLFSAKTSECPLADFAVELCIRSSALYAVCISLQMVLLDRTSERFYRYYDLALTRFRAELARDCGQLNDGTLTAGTLLCTIGILLCTPFTLHLKALDELSFQKSSHESFYKLSEYAQTAMEVVGFMDLPTFVIGRKTRHIGIWKRTRDSQRDSPRGLLDGIEPVSGLPRSLIDIFSRIDETGSDKEFWLWPGHPGEIMQIHLWESYRLAGILAASRVWNSNPFSSPPSFASSEVVLPAPEIILNRLISSLDAMFDGSTRLHVQDLLVMNAIIYPMAMAAAQKEILADHSQWKSLLRRYFATCMARDYSQNVKSCWTLISQFWERNDLSSLEQAAVENDMEIALF